MSLIRALASFGTADRAQVRRILSLLRGMVPQEFRGEEWDRHSILTHYKNRVTRALPGINWRDRDNYQALQTAATHIQTDSAWDGKGMFTQAWLP